MEIVELKDLEQMMHYCKNCGKTTMHYIVAYRDHYAKEYDSKYQEWVYLEGNEQYVRCSQCHKKRKRANYAIPPEVKEKVGYIVDDVLLDGRLVKNMVVRDYPHVPRKLENLYREIVLGFNNFYFTLCGEGIRALIEGVCKDSGVSSGKVITGNRYNRKVQRKRNLTGKLWGLYEKLMLPENKIKKLQGMRFIRELKKKEEDRTPTRDELRQSIGIVEEILEIIYEKPGKRRALRKLMGN